MEELSGEVLKRLDAIAAKLGVTVEMMWDIMTRQGMIQGIYGIIYVALGIVGFFMALKLSAESGFAIRDADRNWREDGADSKFIGGVFALLGSIAALIFSLVLLAQGFGDTKYFFNPEFYALSEILKSIQ